MSQSTAAGVPAGRGWSWAALAWGVTLWIAALPLFGLHVFLAPVGVVLSGLAWWRSPHDDVLSIGLALNGLHLLGLLVLLVGLLTGDVGIGRE